MVESQVQVVRLASGAFRSVPPSPKQFCAGEVVRAGVIQRYILSLHPGFEDSDRINGDFVLLHLSPCSVPDSEWEICEEQVALYASRSTAFPPVVVDENLSFIDGGHRHAAAKMRGDCEIGVFVPTTIAGRLLRAAHPS